MFDKLAAALCLALLAVPVAAQRAGGPDGGGGRAGGNDRGGGPIGPGGHAGDTEAAETAEARIARSTGGMRHILAMMTAERMGAQRMIRNWSLGFGNDALWTAELAQSDEGAVQPARGSSRSKQAPASPSR